MNLLVDASNCLWRAHWVTSKNREYVDMGEVHVFLTMLKSYKNMFPKSNMWLVWDKKLDREIPNPRYGLSEDYKQGRSGAEDVFKHADKITEITTAIGIRNFYPSHLEADDCIAWLSRELKPCVIFSADHDLAQLVDQTTRIYNINTKKTIDCSTFEETFGVSPEIFVLYKSILGDQSDNIKGIPGYGKKRSAKLAKNWDNSNITDEVREIVKENIRMIDLIDNEFLDELELRRYNEQLEKLKDEQPDISKFKQLLEKYSMQYHLNKIGEWENLFCPKLSCDFTNALLDLLA